MTVIWPNVAGLVDDVADMRGSRSDPFLVWWTIGLLTLTCIVVAVLARPGRPDSEWDQADHDQAAAAAANYGAERPRLMRAAVIGDSYTSGTSLGGQEPSSNWVGLAFNQAGGAGRWAVTRKGIGGSGYVNMGSAGQTLADLVPLTVTADTQLVVFFGSRNDANYAGEVGAAAEEAFAQAKAAAPEARLLVIGPPWVGDEVPAAMRANRDAVRSAAVAVGAKFVDPLEEGWFSGLASKLTDGVHPTGEGHAYMAEMIAPHLHLEAD